MEISAPELKASMKPCERRVNEYIRVTCTTPHSETLRHRIGRTLVPDLAMVPKLLTMSALVIPIPVSMMERTLFSLSGMMRMTRSLPVSRTEGSVREA